MWEHNPSAGDPQGVSGGYGPNFLTGHIRDLSVQAFGEIGYVLGPASSPAANQTYLQVGDLLAALRFYRSSIAAAYSDELIAVGLSGDFYDFIGKFIESYQRLPPTADRDQAIMVLQHLLGLPQLNVLVTMVRLVIEKLAAQGY